MGTLLLEEEVENTEMIKFLAENEGRMRAERPDLPKALLWYRQFVSKNLSVADIISRSRQMNAEKINKNKNSLNRK